MSFQFELTEHARKRIADRSIPLEWIERALFHPQKVEPDQTDLELCSGLVTIPEFGNRVLRVIYNYKVNPPRVVTVYFDRAMKGKL